LLRFSICRGGFQSAIGECRDIDGALKCAATKAKSKATSKTNQRELLPGSMNLNRPLQGPSQKQNQRRPPEGDRYKFKGCGRSA
jgi:hypothetical protein